MALSRSERLLKKARPLSRSAQRRTLTLETLEERTVLSFLPPVTFPVGVNPRAVTVADFNNDGILDLVVGLNTSPDLGVGSRQCIVTAYPLDVSQMNPNAPADPSDFEVTPNY